jgi:hypothetical protein
LADARIKVSLQEGTFEVEGSESFVSEQAEKFGDAIRKALSTPARSGPSAPKTPAAKTPDEPNGEDVVPSDHPDVYELHDGKVQVLKDLPGSSAREKTVNAGVICAYAKELAGTPTITFKEIRQVCKDHSCLDSPNFSTALKKDGKEYFVFSGGPQSQALKLSVPGKKKARELLSSMST